MKLGLSALALVLVASTATAQPPARARGVIQALDGQTLVVATPNDGVVFPESMRGAGEGHYAWDLPESTMTNGAATGLVAKGRSGTLSVRYAGGSVEVDVTRRTAIVGLTMGDRALLVPGAAVLALVVPVDGGLMAVAVIAEVNGVKPPM